MNKEQFKEQIAKIQTAYNKKFTQEELKMWFKEFKNVSVGEFEKAIDKTIKTNKFTPKIAEIKAKISENTYRYYADDPHAHLYKNLEWGAFAK